MKKYLFLIIGLVFVLNIQAQSVHNYFSPTTGDYVQIGYNKGYILYRVASPQYQFSRLNYLFSKNGLNYYGTQTFQVAITQDSGRACICTKNFARWYNYCGPVPTPNPFPSNSGYNGGGSSTRQVTSSRCPWCNGTGRITKNDHVPQYTTNSITVDKRCSECGTTYCATYTNHYHLNCGKCGGTGKMTH